VLSKLAKRLLRGPAPGARGFLGDQIYRPVHADRQNVIVLFQAGIDLPMPDIGAIAADACLNDLAIFGVSPDISGQGKQAKRDLERDVLGRRSLWQRGSFGLFASLLVLLAELDINLPVRSVTANPASFWPSSFPSGPNSLAPSASPLSGRVYRHSG